ncbi:MAG: choice-of-anchor D domain-containing protein, partial [Candidatus Sulfotelmatobacter sp.]
VSAGGQCTIEVSAAPTTSGVLYGNLVVTDSDPTSQQMVRLQATGTAVVLSRSRLNFGDVAVNTTSRPQTINVTNTGATTLNIALIQSSTYYSEKNTCGNSLAPGANCNISITFTPTQTGTLTGVLTIVDNDGTSPQTVSLTGTGT